MQFSGAVEATKFLRDRSVHLGERVGVADDILKGKLDIILPRKETVLLEWAFDMVATDSSATKFPYLWELIIVVWPLVPNSAKERVFKNHKFIVNISDALQKTERDDVVYTVFECMILISKTVPILSYATPPQVYKLVLAYLGNKYAVENEKCAYYIHDFVKRRTKIFVATTDSSVIDLIMEERVDEYRTHYLRDYLSIATNTVVPTRGKRDLCEEDFKMLVQSLCAVDVAVESRFLDLCKAYPEHLKLLLSTLFAENPRHVTVDVLNFVLERCFQETSLKWDIIDLVLKINPAPLLENENYMKRMTTDHDIPDSTIALVLLQLSKLRRLDDFLLTWSPPDVMSPELYDAASRAIGTLSPAQIANIMQKIQNNLALELIAHSLTYQTASSPAVSSVLEGLLENEKTPAYLRATILEVLPGAYTVLSKKVKGTELALRAAELDPKFHKPARKALTSKERDYELDALVLRFFPTIERVLADRTKYVFDIIERVTPQTRGKLAQNAAAMECPLISTSLINVLIEKGELQALTAIPKQVFSWDQRHRAVSSALEAPEQFSVLAAIIVRLLDSQNPPTPEKLGSFLNKVGSTPAEVELVVEIVRLIRKDIKYVDSVLIGIPNGWRRYLVIAVASNSSGEQTEESLIDLKSTIEWMKTELKSGESIQPLLYILSYLPITDSVRDTAENIALQLCQSGSLIPPRLFEILTRQNYSWFVVTALYLLTETAVSESDFAKYCSKLNSDELRLLFYTAVEESLYPVMTALVKHHLISAADPSNYRAAINVAILRGTIDSELPYWKFCDSILRESPAFLSQFAVEALFDIIIESKSSSALWENHALVLSRIFLLKRRSLKNRLHLATAALTSLLQRVTSMHMAHIFTRLVDNLCNPPQQSSSRGRDEKQELTSYIAKQRRQVAKHAGVLLQNIVLVILQNPLQVSEWATVSTELRQAALVLVDLIYGDGLKAVSAGMDSASRAYLRSVFDEYKLHGRWSKD